MEKLSLINGDAVSRADLFFSLILDDSELCKEKWSNTVIWLPSPHGKQQLAQKPTLIKQNADSVPP